MHFIMVCGAVMSVGFALGASNVGFGYECAFRCAIQMGDFRSLDVHGFVSIVAARVVSVDFLSNITGRLCWSLIGCDAAFTLLCGEFCVGNFCICVKRCKFSDQFESGWHWLVVILC